MGDVSAHPAIRRQLAKTGDPITESTNSEGENKNEKYQFKGHSICNSP